MYETLYIYFNDHSMITIDYKLNYSIYEPIVSKRTGAIDPFKKNWAQYFGKIKLTNNLDIGQWLDVIYASKNYAVKSIKHNISS